MLIGMSAGQILLGAHGGLNVVGSVKIIQGDKVVASGDAIQLQGGVDTLICDVFNYSAVCDAGPAYYWANKGSHTEIGTACQYWAGATPTLTTGYYSNALCSMSGIALSTDTTGVSTTTLCPSILTTSGLAPLKGAWSSTGGGTVNQAQVQITGSFTPTVSGTTISKLCLIAWNAHSNTYSTAQTGSINGVAASPGFAIDLVSPSYTTTASTPFTVQWTFTISAS